MVSTEGAGEAFAGYAILNAPAEIRRPAIRYHGGKWLLAPKIISHFPSHRVYLEPYGGGASVLLRKPRSYAEIYNDLDGEIVNVFRVLRDRGEELRRALELTPFARSEFELSYVADADPVEQARRTIARGFMGFGSPAASGEKSGFRANCNRSGTTPAHDWRSYPGNVGGMIERLRGVVIEQRDALDLMGRFDSPDTLHYCDPPYVHETRSSKKRGTASGKGYRYEMTNADHRAFAAMVRQLRGMVIVSGYACPLYDQDLFADWPRVEIPARADGARARIEVLWLNARASEQQMRLIAPRSFLEERRL